MHAGDWATSGAAAVVGGLTAVAATPYRWLLEQAYGEHMWTVLVILLVVWAILTVVGFALEGLLWLGIIGIILIVGTLTFGLIRRGKSSKRVSGS